jgi:hypothetical protein
MASAISQAIPNQGGFSHRLVINPPLSSSEKYQRDALVSAPQITVQEQFWNFRKKKFAARLETGPTLSIDERSNLSLFFPLTQEAPDGKSQHSARPRRAIAVNHFQHRDAIFSRTCKRSPKLLISLVASGKSLFEINDPYSGGHSVYPCAGAHRLLHFTAARVQKRSVRNAWAL